MDRRKRLALNAFLHQCPPEKRDLLLRFLPPSEQNILNTLPQIHLRETHPEPLFAHIHWSWLIPLLESYPSHDQRIIIKIFPSHAQKNLAKTCKITPITDRLSQSCTSFLKALAFQQVIGEERLPIDHLPPSPLNALLQIEKTQLTELIDLLALYDLSATLKQIVDTKVLKKIYSALSEREQKFLKTILGHKEPYLTTKISLENWEGTKKALRQILHRVGLARLGSALAQEDPDLIWYVCHQLDIGRGKSLEKFSKTEKSVAVAQWLAKQLEEIL